MAVSNEIVHGLLFLLLVLFLLLPKSYTKAVTRCVVYTVTVPSWLRWPQLLLLFFSLSFSRRRLSFLLAFFFLFRYIFLKKRQRAEEGIFVEEGIFREEEYSLYAKRRREEVEREGRTRARAAEEREEGDDWSIDPWTNRSCEGVNRIRHQH